MSTRETGTQGHGGRSAEGCRAGWTASFALAAAALAVMALAAATALTAPALTAPADQAVPSGETVIERAVAALGGRAPLEKLRNRVLYGAMEVPGLGIEAPLTLYQARPDLQYVQASSPAIGSVTQGCDGETCWESSSLQGPRIKKDGERAMSMRDADFDGLANWRRWYAKVDSVAADTAAGVAVWRVIMTPKEGEPEAWYFDQSSGLPVKEKQTIVNEMGAIPIVSYPGDFRRAAGILVPFRTRQVMMNGLQTVVMAVDSVAYNVDIPAGRFDLPPEIRALMAKQAAADSAAAVGDSSRTPWGGALREEKRK